MSACIPMIMSRPPQSEFQSEAETHRERQEHSRTELIWASLRRSTKLYSDLEVEPERVCMISRPGSGPPEEAHLRARDERRPGGREGDRRELEAALARAHARDQREADVHRLPAPAVRREAVDALAAARRRHRPD